MAGRWRELFRQDFTSSADVEVVHNKDIEYPAVKVLIDGDFRPDLISSISVKSDDPTNILFVCLGSPQTGVIQLIEYDVVPAGVISATNLVALGLGQPDGVFGTEYAYAEDLTESTTVTPVFAQKLRLSVTGITAGTYHIGCNFTWNTNATGADFQAQLEIDDTDIVWNQFSEPQDSNADQKYPSQALSIRAGLAAGNHTIDLDFAISAGSTGRIAQARIEFWRIL